MSSVTSKKKRGLQVGSYIETTTPIAIHARVDIKNSLRPKIKIQHQPMPTGSLSWQIQALQKT